MGNMLKEFKEFAMKGNVVDMQHGVIAIVQGGYLVEVFTLVLYNISNYGVIDFQLSEGGCATKEKYN